MTLAGHTGHRALCHPPALIRIRNKPWKIFRTLKKIFVSHGPRREWLSQRDVCSKANIKMTPLGDNGNKTWSRLFQVVIL